MISNVVLVSPQDILIRRVSGQYAKYIWRQFSLPILRNLSSKKIGKITYFGYLLYVGWVAMIYHVTRKEKMVLLVEKN